MKRELITHGLQEEETRHSMQGSHGGSTRVGSRKGKDQACPGGTVASWKGKLSQGEKLESSQWALGCRAISRSLIPGVIMGTNCLLKPKTQTEEGGALGSDSFTCMLEVSWQGNQCAISKELACSGKGSLFSLSEALHAEASRMRKQKH